MTQRRWQDEFPAWFGAHRVELRAHCYRMTGSITDAEDLAQETFLRAWRSLRRYEGRSSPQTWLYRIATNACLDHLARHERRARPTDTIADILEHEAWISPCPDRVDPADTVAARETTGLYLTAALMHLPPRQRAAVVARDLAEFDATETAAILGCSTTAVHSLLQRAHARLRHLGASLHELALSAPDDHEADLVLAYIDAHDRGDIDTIVGLLDRDVRISMPPEPPIVGAPAARAFYADLLGPGGPGTWRLVPTRANGHPAIANYVHAPGERTGRATSVDVLHIGNGRITTIHCFLGGSAFNALGLAHLT